MNVDTQIGLNGTQGVVVEEKCDIPIVQAKKGIMLYTNKVLALKLKPQLLLPSEGKMRIESGYNFEFINTDINKVQYKPESII